MYEGIQAKDRILVRVLWPGKENWSRVMNKLDSIHDSITYGPVKTTVDWASQKQEQEKEIRLDFIKHSPEGTNQSQGSESSIAISLFFCF